MAAIAPALALLLSACAGDDPEPRFEAEPSSSPVSSPTTSPAAAEPEPWEEKTPEGAVAFVEHWVATFNAAVASGDTNELAKLSETECSSCDSLKDFIDETYGAGGSIEGGDWRLQQIRYSSPDGGETVGVAGKMAIPTQTVNDSNGQSETSSPLRADYFFTLAWRREAWSVSAIATDS